MTDQAQIEKLTAAVLDSTKYRTINPELVRRVAADELAKGRKFKDTVKAIKNKLHQVGGAYLGTPIDYPAWLERLRDATPEARPKVCRQVMALHASTKERLPILETFYQTIFVKLPPFASLLDVACGLNPLALPWMGLPPGTTYYACDIYADMVDFVEGALEIFGQPGEAFICDVVGAPPAQKVDVALILKAIPCLEQIGKGAGELLLNSIQANHLVVSYPVHSLGGRGKGMRENYESSFMELVAGKNWGIEKLAFETELVFLINK